MPGLRVGNQPQTRIMSGQCRGYAVTANPAAGDTGQHLQSQTFHSGALVKHLVAYAWSGAALHCNHYSPTNRLNFSPSMPVVTRANSSRAKRSSIPARVTP
jgi:hypothetical protein